MALKTVTWQRLLRQSGVSLIDAAVDAQDWSGGQSRLIRDINSGDTLFWSFTTGNNAMQLWGSQNNGPMMYLAADATNASGTQPNLIVSVCQDSAGRVHCLSFGNADHIPYYTRFTLNYSGGHVVSYTIDRSALALPDHTPDVPHDARGNIMMVTNGGVEKVFWQYQGSYSTNTLLRAYGGYMSALTGTNTSVGVDGTGSDTLLYSTATSTVKSNHTTQMLICQDKTSEDVYLYTGQFNSDYALGSLAAGADNDLSVVRLTAGSGVWSVGSATAIVTIPGGGGFTPQVLGTCSAAGKAALMYYDPAGTVSFGYMNGSTWTGNWVTPPYSPGNRAAFGVFWTDGTIILAIYNTYSSTASTVDGYISYWDGTRWLNVFNTPRMPFNTTGGSEGCSGVIWSNGIAMIDNIGSTTAQTTTGRALSMAYFYTPPTYNDAPTIKRKRYCGSLTMGLDVREWW